MLINYIYIMKKEKQEVLKKILDSGNYEVDTQTGAIYRKGKFVKPQILPSGYYQHTLFLGRGTGVR